MAARILIVDDNEVVRGVLTETLTTHDGWEVCAALENGEQAVMKAAELSPDLIILDLAMPVMDGLTATREIAKILPSVPVVIYTLHNAAWLQLEAQRAGARAVVSKPEVLKLIDVAEDLLREKSSAQSLIGFPRLRTCLWSKMGLHTLLVCLKSLRPASKPPLLQLNLNDAFSRSK